MEPRTLSLTIHDDGDDVRYKIAISEEDALNMANMEILHQKEIEIPSIGGWAVRSGLNITFTQAKGTDKCESIGTTIPKLSRLIEQAQNELNEIDAEE